MLDSLLAFSESRLGPLWGPALYELATSLFFIVCIVVPLMLSVAYLTLWERKLIGWMQIRIGPNRVGPLGLFQPIDSVIFNWIPPLAWLAIKMFFVVSLFLWFRATFPRYRYDQIMRLGWKIFIPVTLVWLVVIGVRMQTPWSVWK